MESMMGKVVPVIMSGGMGSRLWPLSRESHPKPFIVLPDGESLLQKTFRRALGLAFASEVVTVTREELYFQTLHAYETLGCSTLSLPTSFILEPVGRNTAPAIAVTALQLAKHYDPDTIMAVLPSDHLIPDQLAFQASVKEALLLAQEGFLVTLGLKPNCAETAYGYLEIDARKRLHQHSYRVVCFSEKPNKASALNYLASGKHFWNAGMFFFSIATLITELERHCDDLLSQVKHCFSRSLYNEKQKALRLDAETFAAVPNISLDYALMEKSTQVAMTSGHFQWNDVGSWNALSDLISPDDHGNQTIGNVVTHDTENCYVQCEDRVVGTIGVDNLTIVDTKDALLIAKRDRVQEVKQLVELLKEHDSEIVKYHKQVERPWGYFTVLQVGLGFKIKKICVRPKAALSLQSHQYRSEHWIVVAGSALVTNGDKNFYLKQNESTFIPAGNQHRIENPDDSELILIEVQCGHYLGEDDIVRYQDKYERVT